MIKGKKDITIIQGDSYQKNIIIENVEHELISAVYISCDKLNICKQLEYVSKDNKYRLYFTRQETAVFGKGLFDYDITIKFIQDIVKTIPYRASFVVLPKTNKVGCLQ